VIKDTEEIRFGVEQEHFVLHADGSVPSAETIESVWRSLAELGYKDLIRNENGELLGVSRDDTLGRLIITSDACTNIVEVAFPPMDSLTLFADFYETVWSDVREALTREGLQVVMGGVLPDPLSDVVWRAKQSDVGGKRLSWLLSRPENPGEPMFMPEIAAHVAATQISLGVMAKLAATLLPTLYGFEFLAPLWFSQSPRFLGVSAHCIRPLVIERNFQHCMTTVGVPQNPPRNIEEYQHQFAGKNVRDYSFIAIRDEDRLEFRSTCTQPTSADICDLIRLRRSVADAARAGISCEWDSKAAFQDACCGRPTPAQQAADLLAPFFDHHGFDWSQRQQQQSSEI